MDINKLIENASRIDIPNVIGDAIDATKDGLVEQQKDQLLQGRTATGERIGKYKNKYYSRKKFNMNPLAGYGNVDLKLTGEFFRHIQAKVFSRSVFLTSTDSKTDELEEKYGEDIFGLRKENATKYSRERIAPAATTKIKSMIHGM